MPTQPLTPQNIPLENIALNPYRTRRPNPARVLEIAYSIHRNGLIQPPTGRYFGHTQQVQLAAGNTRYEAYRLLHTADETLFTAYPDLERYDPARYSHLPVILREMTEQELFEIMAIENHNRDDLTPIELAEEMLVYREKFSKSSEEIGQLYGMSGPTVRNLLRLLDLPEPDRIALAEGRMSQGTARALLTYYALPEKFRSTRFWSLGRYWAHDDIVNHAHEGGLASNIEILTAELLRVEGKKFDGARWKAADLFDGPGIHHPDCHTCPARIKHRGQYYCTVPTCYQTKERKWQQDYLAQAAQAADLPIFTESKERTTTFEWASRTPILTKAYERRCPNLCVAFNSSSLQNNGKGYEKVTVPGFPGAEMICKKMNQHCTCLQAKEAGVSLPTPEPTAATVEPDYEKGKLIITIPEQSPAPLTEADLKAIRQNIHAQKKENQQQSKAIRLEAERQFLSTLNLFNLKAWKLIAKKLHYDCGQDAQTWDDLTAAIAAQIIHDEFKYMNLEDLDRLQRKAQELNDKLGLVKAKQAPTVSTETPPSHS